MVTAQVEPAVDARADPRAPRLIGRRVIAVALVTGLCAISVLLGTGLLSDSPRGAGDNGDGVRLYCGAGIAPDTPSGRSNWQGVVVDTFRTGESSCIGGAPSSALPPLVATVRFSQHSWNLRSLGWTWFAVLTAVFGLAAAAAGAVRPWRALVVLPVAVPLALPVFSRFLLSTYAEPAGLVGTAATLAGIAAAAASPPRGAARPLALALALGGGTLAATAKPAFIAVLLPALAICVLFPPLGRRRVGALVAILVAVGMVAPLQAALEAQDAAYGAVNTHNLVFTAVGVESRGDALTQLGLPGSASQGLGSGFYLDGGSSVPQWAAVVGAHWPRLREDARTYVLTHPRTAWRMLNKGLVAVSDPRITYLPMDLRSAPDAVPIPPPPPTFGEQGASSRTLEQWLESRPLGSLPLVLLLIGALVGLIEAGCRRRSPSVSSLATLAVTAVSCMLLVTVAAVMGDGYFELAKHTWLAAYAASVGAVATLSWGLWRALSARQGAKAAPASSR